MNEKDTHELFIRWREAEAEHPQWRRGQALFNTLWKLHPEIANAIRGDDHLDPFHNDHNIQNLWQHLAC